MAIISDNDKSFKRSSIKNPNIKSESIEYDKSFENSILDNEYKKSKCDFIINNDGTLVDLEKQINNIKSIL